VERSLQETAAAMRRMVLSIVLLFFVGDPVEANGKNDTALKRLLFAVLDFLPYLAYVANLAEFSVPELIATFQFFIRKIKDLTAAWESP
jgi:hypothetical protein